MHKKVKIRLYSKRNVEITKVLANNCSTCTSVSKLVPATLTINYCRHTQGVQPHLAFPLISRVVRNLLAPFSAKSGMADSENEVALINEQVRSAALYAIICILIVLDAAG